VAPALFKQSVVAQSLYKEAASCCKPKPIGKILKSLVKAERFEQCIAKNICDNMSVLEQLW
jgi:hypothetical protein